MLKSKVNKKALAVQVLLGLMVAGNACAATSITVTGENGGNDWGKMETSGTDKIICDAYSFITSKPDGSAYNNFGPVLGGSLLLPGGTADISNYDITMDVGVQGNNFTLIKGKNVTNNTITIGQYWPRKIDLWGTTEISNIFSGSESSKDNTFKLGILESDSTVESVNVGDENDVVLTGGTANNVTANYSAISFAGRNLTLDDNDGTEAIKSANMKGNITATRALNVTNDIFADGDISASGGLTAGGNIKGATINTGTNDLRGNEIMSAEEIIAGGISAENISASAITASGAINVAGLVDVLNGTVTQSRFIRSGRNAATGDVQGTSIEAGRIVANNVIVTSGNIVAGSIDATGNVTADSGSITLNNEASNIGGTIQTNGLTITGTSTLKADTVKADNLTINSTAQGTIFTANTVQKKDGTPIDLAAIVIPNETNEKTALFNKTYGTSVKGNSVQRGLVKAEVREQSKSLVETQIAAMALTNGSADLLAGAGFANAAQAVKDERESGAAAGEMVPFAAANYGSMRQESGSYVDVDSANFNVGFAKEVKNSKGTLLFGPMIEYGQGNYESHLGDGTIGTGNGQSFGVGVMARQINNDGLYYEGSARYGKSTSDYSSNNLVPGRNISYDNSANYWGVHAGVGKVLQLQGDNSIDVYGKLFYTRQGSSSVDVDGDTLDFDALSSKRSRIGFRYIHGTSKVRSVYAGLAWQYEFDGAARATANGFSTPSPSVKGSSGMLELGVLVAPKASPVSFDLGVSGWAGKQKGYAVNANMCWHF